MRDIPPGKDDTGGSDVWVLYKEWIDQRKNAEKTEKCVKAFVKLLIFHG